MKQQRYAWLTKAAPAGGKARMRRLTRDERQALARMAALARWKRTPRGAAVSEAARKAVLARWARAKGKKALPRTVASR